MVGQGVWARDSAGDMKACRPGPGSRLHVMRNIKQSPDLCSRPSLAAVENWKKVTPLLEVERAVADLVKDWAWVRWDHKLF